MKKSCCILLTMALLSQLFIGVSYAQENTVELLTFYENSFDNGTVGATPTGENVRETGVTGTVRVADKDGNLCINLQNDETAEGSQAYWQISPGISLTGKAEISYRVLFDRAFGTVNLPQIYDSEGNNSILIKMTQLSKLGVREKIVGKCDDDWVSVRIIVDIDSDTYDVYVNDRLMAEQFELPKALKDISSIRFAMYRTNGGSIWLDDAVIKAEPELAKKIIAMGGTESAPHASKLTLNSDVLKQIDAIIDDSVVMAVGSTKVYVNGEEKRIDENFVQKPQIVDGRTMVPMRFLSESFDASVLWDDATHSVTIKTADGSKTIVFQNNSKTYSVNSATLEMDVVPYMMDGRMYIPIRYAAEALGKKVYWAEPGLIFIGDTEIPFDTEEKLVLQSEIYDMVRYIRPTADEMLEKLVENNPGNQHPRLILTNDIVEQIKSRIQTDQFSQTMYKYIKTQADAIFKMDVGTYSIKEVYRLGDDTKLAGPRIEKLALMYLLTGEESYAQRAWQEMEAACSWPDWNAHQHYLDTGRLLGEIAIGYDWLYNYLTEAQREIVRTALIEKGMKTALDVYEGAITEPNLTVFWITNGYNWNATCNGGLITAALAIGDEEPEISGKILEYALLSTEYLLDTFAPDGGWVEGTSYWRVTAETLLHSLAKMKTAMGTYFDYLNVDGIAETCYFAKYMTGPVMPFNFSDGGSTSELQLPFLFWAAKELNNSTLAADRKESALEKGVYEVYDLIWYDPEFAGAEQSKLSYDRHIRKLEVATLRNGWDDNATFVGLRSGDNTPSHAHYDIGSFVFDSMGERWFEDLGSDRATYTGTAKAKAYRLRAEGHNTFVLNNSKADVQTINNGDGLTRVFYDDFNAYSDEDSPGFDLSIGGSGAISLPTEGDNRYVKLSCADTINTSKAYIQKSFSDFSGGALHGNVSVEFDIKIEKAQGDVSPINLRDTNKIESGSLITFSKNGTLLVVDSGEKRSVMDYELNRWYKLKILVDTNASTFTVYVDGQAVAQNCSTTRNIENITLVRFPIFYKIAALGMDNIAVYADVTAEEIKASANEAADQSKGYSCINTFVSKPKGGYAITDLTPAYASWAKSARRGVMLYNNRQHMIVRDEITTKSPMDYYWFAHTKADIDVSDDGKSAYLTLNDKKLYAEILSQENATFSVMKAEPLRTSPNPSGQSSNEEYQKLTVHIPDTTNINMSIMFVPMGLDENIPDKPQVQTLDEFAIPDGEINYIDSIYIDGELIENFAPETLTYNVTLPKGTTKIPSITTDETSRYEITMPENLPGSAKICVYDLYNNKINYYINLMPEKERILLHGTVCGVDITEDSISSMSVQQPENPPKNVIDNDLSTRFAAEGSGEWLQVDFGHEISVESFSVAFMNGNSRVYSFEILTSADGETWDTALADGKSSGTTNDLEKYSFAPRKARYIRIVGYGNTTNAWNSITEIR